MAATGARDERKGRAWYNVPPPSKNQPYGVKINIEMKIKNVLNSTREKLESGEITMREARENLCHYGWFPYLPSEEQVKNLLAKFAF